MKRKVLTKKRIMDFAEYLAGEEKRKKTSHINCP